MTLRFPFLSIRETSGADLVARLGSDFVGVHITDRADGEVDECQIRLRRTLPFRLLPPKGTEFEVRVGWSEADALITGTYRLNAITYSGDPESGQELRLICRAADMSDALKRFDSEHFDEETGHKTYGDVFKTLAQRGGLALAIDPDIAALPLPGGYLLRWRQSEIGLATDLAEELGAIVKPQAGRLTIRRLASFKSPSGQSLPVVPIPYDPSYAYEVMLEPIYSFGEVSGAWFDAAKGRMGASAFNLVGGLARFALPHLVGSEQLAVAMAEGASQRLEMQTATGVFEVLGTSLAVAGAPVRPDGFGPDVDGVNWVAECVEHEIGPDRGWITTISTVNAGGTG